MKEINEEQNLVGHVDICDGFRVAGWIVDFKNLHKTISIQIKLDDKVIYTIPANLPRSDLSANHSFENTNHAFDIVISDLYHDGKKHELTVIEADSNFQLNNFRHLVNFPNKNLPVKLDLALVGKEDWLFLCNDSNKALEQYMGLLKIDDKLLEGYRAEYGKRQSYFKRQGVEYYFMLVPGKEYIYSEFLPENIVKAEVSNADLFLNSLKEIFENPILDCRQILINKKYEGQLYYKHDSHWNFHGAYLANCELVRLLQEKFKNIVPLENYDIKLIYGEEPLGDLGEKSFLDYLNGEYIPCQNYQTRRAMSAIKIDFKQISVEVESHQYQFLSKTRPTRLFRNPEAKELPRAIIVRDSFCDWMISMLRESFSECLFVWARGVDEDVIKSFKPDIIIEQVVDRFLISNRYSSKF